MINVTVWNENLHEQFQAEVREIYPDGIHGCIAEFLSYNEDLNIRTATFDEEEHGLTQEVLDHTDVLIYWSHMAQEEFSDMVAERIHQAVLRGMGLIALHSAHYSKMMKKILGTSMTLNWRHGDRERLFVTAPQHPIAKYIPEYFELPVEEMYGEYFDIPKPDDVVFTGWFAGGEVFRSGCTFTRGLGKIFYFQPGHEMYPTYYDKYIQRIITNAVYWCEPIKRLKADPQCHESKIPPEAISGYAAKARRRQAAEQQATGQAAGRAAEQQATGQAEERMPERLAGQAIGQAAGHAAESPTAHLAETERGLITQNISGVWRGNGNEGLYEKADARDALDTGKPKDAYGKNGDRFDQGIRLSIFYEHLREAGEQTGKPLRELLQEARRAGISGVEMEFSTLFEHPELNREIKDAGMEISNLYQFFDFGNHYAAGMHTGRKMIDMAKKMGIARVMIIPGFLEQEQSRKLNRLSASYDETAAFMEQLPEILAMRDALLELSEYAAEKGIMVSMEDFDSFTSPIARMNPMKWFLEQVPGLKHTLDMGNYAFSNESAEEAYELFRDRIGHVHCKDRGEEKEEDPAIREELGMPAGEELLHRKGLKPVPAGDGYMPIAKLVEKLKEQGYQGYLAIEHFGAPDQLGFMLKSAEFLKKLLE